LLTRTSVERCAASNSGSETAKIVHIFSIRRQRCSRKLLFAGRIIPCCLFLAASTHPYAALPCLSFATSFPEQPVIETSSEISFGPFRGAYKEHAAHVEAAGLAGHPNLWWAVFDFNDEAKTGANWKLLSEEEWKDVWRPLGGDDEIAAAYTEPNTVPVSNKLRNNVAIVR
jgi:hypothetical protein